MPSHARPTTLSWLGAAVISTTFGWSGADAGGQGEAPPEPSIGCEGSDAPRADL